MKINYQYIFIVILTSLQVVNAEVVTSQSQASKKGPGYKMNWTVDPFDNRIFIENKGQFAADIPNTDKILYGAQVGEVYTFITNCGGIIYKYTEQRNEHIRADGKRETADPDDVDWTAKPIEHYLTATWKGSTNNVTTVAGEEQTYYSTYPMGGNKTIRANVFKKVTCMNVYPGIDVEYLFPKSKEGVKYTLIVHPGADLSLVKLKYNGAENMFIDRDGNVNIGTSWGEFIDHAPVSSYREDNMLANSGYKINDNEESFNVTNLDATKTLIVDPLTTNWTEAPPFSTSGYDGAYDVDFDYAGNVYVYGGYDPFKLIKYNSAGVELWSFSTTNFADELYGDFCVDKGSGIAFCLQGFGGGGNALTDKISASGASLGTFPPSGTSSLDEQWRASYDLCDHIILVAGGGTNASLQAETIDTTLSAATIANVLGSGTALHDFSLIATDPLLDVGYMATAQSVVYPSVLDNVLLQMPLPTMAPVAYNVADNYTFEEVGSVAYVGGFTGEANGMNGMAVSPNWLYMYDGLTLKQLIKNTGALNASATLPGVTSFDWGGLDVDLCDDIYAGNQTNVLLYNSSLTQTGTIGPFPGNVYDVVLGNGVLSAQDSTLYVCGNGFLSSVKLSTPNSASIVKTRTLSCSCNCTATGTVSFCGSTATTGVTYLWSNGETTQTATGLCPGNTYTLTIKLGCADEIQDTFNFPVGGSLNVSTTATPVTCTTSGTATATASGGVNPYTYSWSQGGQTSATITGLSAGTYTVSVSDNTGCSNTTTVIVTSSSGNTAVITSTTNILCHGGNTGSATVGTTSGGNSPYTYSWNPAGGTNATGTGLSAGTYTVTLTDNSGCSATASVTITQPATAITATTTTTQATCGASNGTATVSASGGTPAYTYSWSPGGQTTANATGLSAGNYTITITDNNGCTQTTTASITSTSSLTVSVTISVGALCNGGNNGRATVTASSGTSPYTYSWSPAGGTTATGTGLSAGTYTVTVTDANGCNANATVTITEPPLLTATTGAPTNVLCNGGATGSATVTAGGGTPSYTYSWAVAGGSNATGTGLSAGTYTVTVTDNNGCTAIASVTITEPAAITATTSTTQATCGAGNGTATVIASGGMPAYTYSWNPSGNTNSTATGLSSGTYTITITDNNGCIQTSTAIITSTSSITATISASTNVSCNGGTNGSATVTAGGGASPYSYSWAASGGTNATGTGLGAGTYTVTIMDNNGCTITTSVTVTEPPILTATMGIPTNVLCNGGSSGSATVTAGGGTSPYTYSWAAAGGTTATGTGLSAATYTVTVTDNNGCIVTSTVTITEAAAISITTTTTAAACGASNGTATVTASGGVPAYTYLWTPSGNTTITATGLSVGVYTVSVTDNNGCVQTATVIISSSSGLAATITASNNITCNGGINGSATITATGGSTPYTYLWNPSGNSTATATGLSAGTYTITVTDNNGCTAVNTVTITQPPLLTATMGSPTNVLCNGGTTGSATVTAAGGTSPYAYSWAPAGGTNATGSGLSAATYTVTVTDNNGCSVTSSVTITEPPLLTATMGVPTNGLCSGGNSSSVTVTVTGGTAAYTYSWTPTGGTSATASGLSAGTYTVNVTDNNGCIVSSTVTITVPTALSVTLSTTGTTCSGSSNGSITATAAGGTAPYTYSWTPAGGNGATASNLGTGTYTVTVTDANGCTTTASAIVSGSAALTVTASGPNSICSGGNATLTSGVSGGTGPYTYLWSSGGTTATTIVNPTTTTTYTLTVTDANGCSATATVTVTTNQALGVGINGSDSPFCAGDSTILTATASGGDGAYTYLWLPGNTTTYSVIASPSSTTIYTVEVTSGCGSGMVTATFTVTVNPLPVTSFEANPASGCAPLCVQFRDLSTVGGGTITQWEWGFGKYDSIGPKNPDYCYPDTGSFTVSLTTTSNSGCRSTLTKVNMVTVYPPPNASFTYSPQPVDILDPVVQFTSTSSGRYPLIYWYWTFGDGTNSISYLLNPEHTYSDTGTFCATLVVENQFGCMDSVTDCVVVNPDFTLYIPDAFSPNGDGLNDIFMPKGNYIKDYDLYIFNRWEAQIFHTNDINTGWNGKVNGSGTVCQQDTYFYLINVTDSRGKLHSYTGEVTLLK